MTDYSKSKHYGHDQGDVSQRSVTVTRQLVGFVAMITSGKDVGLVLAKNMFSTMRDSVWVTGPLPDAARQPDLYAWPDMVALHADIEKACEQSGRKKPEYTVKRLVQEIRLEGVS